MNCLELTVSQVSDKEQMLCFKWFTSRVVWYSPYLTLFCENLWIGSIKQKYLCIRNASCEKLWIIPISLDWSISPQSPLPHGVAWDEGKGKRRTGRKTGQLPERSYMEPVVLIEKKTVTSAHIFWELIHVQRILSMKCRLKELDYGGVGGGEGIFMGKCDLMTQGKIFVLLIQYMIFVNEIYTDRDTRRKY